MSSYGFFLDSSVAYGIIRPTDIFFYAGWDIKDTSGRKTSREAFKMERNPLCIDCVKINEISSVLHMVAPEAVEILEDRYNILKMVSYLQPVGRRSLSTKLNMTERVIRKEANRLKDQGLVEFSLEGMAITEEGQVALDMLMMFFHDLRGLKDLELDLAKKLQIKKVIIGSSGIMEEDLTLRELGKSAADYLKSILRDDSVIGITGGTSVYSIIDGYRKEKIPFENAIVVPARGGLGKKTEYQANTLAEKLADKLGSHYRMLYTPDNLSQAAIESLKKEPEIDEIIQVLNRINVLAFGIGKAQKMAERRSLDDAEIGKIIDKGAVSEAFGYYFNKTGEKVHEISTIGIDLDKFKAIEDLIAVASGDEKIEAIVSICKLNKNLVLVTDENVAKIILNKEV